MSIDTPAGRLRADALEAGLGRLDHRDGVGAGLAPHVEHDGRHAVQARERALLPWCRPRRGRCRGRGSASRCASRSTRSLNCSASAKRPDGAQRPLVDVGGDVAAGQVGVLLLQRVADLGDRQLVGGEAIGLDPDVHRALEAADDLHFADARRALERHLDDLVGDLGQLADRQVARQRDRQDRRADRCPA